MTNLSSRLSTVPTQCDRCLKSLTLCVCDRIRVLENKIHVLVLQHPQEPDKDLGSARIAHLSLKNSNLSIGLSWPNLRSALLDKGKSNTPTQLAAQPLNPAQWAVLYLGSGAKKGPTPGVRPGPLEDRLLLVDRKGQPIRNQQEALSELRGFIILDGTWSQAKTLWWRNAWLLKLRRAVVQTSRKSLYRELRREPRRECLSTIESAAVALSVLNEPHEVRDQLLALFSELLNRKRQIIMSKK